MLHIYEAAPPLAGEDPPRPNRDPHPYLGPEDPYFGSFPFAARRNSGSLESLISAPPTPPSTAALSSSKRLNKYNDSRQLEWQRAQKQVCCLIACRVFVAS